MSRAHRRLVWSLPGILLVGALGMLLLLLWVSSALAARAFDDGDLGAAETSYERQEALTRVWPEPWKASYNLGTARLAQAAYEGAVEPLRDALVRVPAAVADEDGRLDPASPECRVRSNLAAALEGVAAGVGDEQAAASARAEAAEVIAPCRPPDEPEPEPTQSPSPPPGESPSPTPAETPSDPRLEELQERNDRAREEAELERQGDGGGFGGGQNW
ncbi:MAG: hypothetical protein ACQERF_08965 [Actinomycetota bacterium]